MTVRNIQDAAQECNGRKKIVSINGMPAHLCPFLFGECTFLLQNMVRDPHFADIMKQHPAINVHHLSVVDANISCQPHSHVCDSPGMALCFPVTQFQGACPAFQRRVVRLDQFLVRALQIFKQLGAVYCNGSLTRQSMQELHPIRGRWKRGAMKYFEDPLDLSLDNQRDAHIGHEPLSFDKNFIGCFRGVL